MGPNNEREPSGQRGCNFCAIEFSVSVSERSQTASESVGYGQRLRGPFVWNCYVQFSSTDCSNFNYGLHVPVA